MLKVAVILLAIAVACGATLFTSAATPKSIVLHAAFIVSSIAFIVAMVAVLVGRATTDTRDSLHIRVDEPDPAAVERRDGRDS